MIGDETWRWPPGHMAEAEARVTAFGWLGKCIFMSQGGEESALIFCGGLTPADFQIAFKRLEEQSRELEAAQVETMGAIGGKKPHPATSPAS